MLGRRGRTEVSVGPTATAVAALMGAGEFGQSMRRKLSALSGRHLTASNQSLKRRITKCKTVEVALRKSGKPYKELLEEALVLQAHLRHLPRRMLSAQEAERKQISCDLQDDIAQALLGINLRLETLKKAARGERANLKKEIADTQRLVQDSVRSINRFARELNIHPQA